MNKKGLVEKIAKELGFNIKDSNTINEILENNLLIGKKNKDKIIRELSEKLNIDKKDADKIYNKAVSIIGNEIKKKIKNPFKNQD